MGEPNVVWFYLLSFCIVLPTLSGTCLGPGCNLDPMCFFYAGDCTLTGCSPFNRLGPVSCDQCIKMCTKRQTQEYPYICKSAVYDCATKTCDIYNVDDRLYGRLAPCRGSVYFRPTWTPQCMPQPQTVATKATTAATPATTVTMAPVTEPVTPPPETPPTEPTPPPTTLGTEPPTEGTQPPEPPPPTEGTIVPVETTNAPETTAPVENATARAVLRNKAKSKKAFDKSVFDTPLFNGGEWSLWSPCVPRLSLYSYRYRQCPKADTRQCQKERVLCKETAKREKPAIPGKLDINGKSPKNTPRRTRRSRYKKSEWT